MLKHRLVFVTGLALLLSGVSQWLVAQNSPSETPGLNSAQEERAAPLPTYWGKLALNSEQRQKVNTIRDEYSARIDELRQQIGALVKERDARMERELSPGQKLRLQELREEARLRAAEAKAAESNGTPATAASPAVP